MYYSASTGGFYSQNIHGSNIPSDCVPITADHHKDLLTRQSQGEEIVADSQGYPTSRKRNQTVQGLFIAIQAEKSRIKNGGFKVNGTLFDSDDAAQVAYLLYASKFSANPTYVVENWKASTGQWVRMDSVLFNQVVAALETHIAACFAWQQAKEHEISACTTAEDLNAISTIYGI